MSRKHINTALLGLGRLGQIYARYLAFTVPRSNLVAVADTKPGLAKQIADELSVEHWYEDPSAVMDNEQVDAVVIATPTITHRDLIEAAVGQGKDVFCEKPLSLSLDESLAIQVMVEKSGVFFQMGFMRRFDRGFVAAKQQLDDGSIGTPVLFRATSRDPFPASLDYLHPKNSGGLMIDMGIHDFDQACWLVGDVRSVNTIGGVLSVPDLESIGDVDTAVVTLTFENGALGVVDLSRNGVYGYDIFTEIVGNSGTLRVGYLQETPLLVMTENRVAHDTVPFFPERFGEAYVRQLENFISNLLNDHPPPVTIADGIRALRIGIAATRAYHQGTPVNVQSVPLGSA